MAFYVYFDPEVISVAQRNGEYAMQALIAVLDGFVQNCFIAEFDGSLNDALREQVERLPEDFDRKRIIELLKVLKKRNRFIYSLTLDYAAGHSFETHHIESALSQADESLLDLLLLAALPEGDQLSRNAETTTLSTYQHTYFATTRSRLACDGVILEEAELAELEVLDRYLRKALKYAGSIEICDNLFGEKYQGNYQYTAQVLLTWLGKILAAPTTCRIIFHCGVPGDQARDLQVMKAEMTELKHNRLAGASLQLFLYPASNSKKPLPHDRFIVTDQIAIGIGRGMDFLDRKTHKNRDLTIDYRGQEQAQKLLKSYDVEGRSEFEL